MRGFTLVEILLAATVMALIAGATAGMYAANVRLQEQTAAREEARRAAIEVYRQIERDLRSAWPLASPPPREVAEDPSLMGESMEGAFYVLSDGGAWWTVRGDADASDLVLVRWRLMPDGELRREMVPHRSPSESVIEPDYEVFADRVLEFEILTPEEPDGTLPPNVNVRVLLERASGSQLAVEEFVWTFPCTLYRDPESLP